MKAAERILRGLGVAMAAVVATVACGQAALAQTTTNWIGTGSDQNWSTAGNWDNGVPTSTSNVVIGPSLMNNYSVTLDVGANVNNLLLGSSSTLTFGFGQTLVVSGSQGNPTFATDLQGQTNVYMGTLELDSASSGGTNRNINYGTITLSRQTLTVLGHTFTLGSGTIDGTGTLENVGTIQGSGTVSINLINTGTIVNNDSNGETLFLNGNIQNSGGTILENSGGVISMNGATVSGGTIGPGTYSLNNETLDGGVTLMGSTEGRIQFAAGSTVNIGAGGATNGGLLDVAAGTVISGPGTLANSGSPEGPTVIQGAMTISANINNFGNILATDASNPIVLQGAVTQHSGLPGTGYITMASGSVILDGAQVSGGTISASGTGQLTAENGAALTGVAIDGTHAPVVLTDGSSLGIAGSLGVTGELQLGSGAEGATLSVASGTPSISLFNNSEIHGGGTIAPAIDIVGSNASVVADNPSVALVLKGNVSGIGTLSATNGATLTLDPISVNAAAVTIDAGSKLNGDASITAGQVTNNGTLTPGLGTGGQIAISGKYEQGAGGALEVDLGGTGAGQFSQLVVEGDDPHSVIPVAYFDPGSTIDAEFVSGFDPSSGCATTFGVCESWVIAETEAGAISGFSNLTLDALSALPSGFEWQLLEENNATEIVLDIEGMSSGTSGGSGGSGGGGNGGGTTTPEPSSLFLLGAGLIGLAGWRRRAQVQGIAESQGVQA